MTKSLLVLLAVFAFLKGVVHSKELTGGQDDRLVLDVAGVGFDIRMAPASLLAVADPGEVALIHTWLSVRENDLTIFGFETVRQRKLFQALLKVTGVGPKMALSITGTLGVNQLIDAIAREDTKAISQAPGVGKKVAERLVLELKSKLDTLREGGESGTAGDSTGAPNQEEVRSILEGLGYTMTEINIALEKALQEEMEREDVEGLVRFSLRVLGSQSLK